MLSEYPQLSYLQLLNACRDVLAAKYSQKPQSELREGVGEAMLSESVAEHVVSCPPAVSSSHPIDLNLVFTI